LETRTDLNVWLVRRCINSQAALRLFCFPYAGGSASAYNAWSSLLPPHVELCPVQLPGRDSRLTETPYKRIEPLVEALAIALLPAFDKPFAFFGHSLGALVSFELARYLRRQRGPQPMLLLVSGARAPQLPNPEPPIHQLPEKAFVEAISRFNGTPAEILQHEELMKLLLPCLRADFEIYETYQYRLEDPLSMPIAVFGGWQDGEVAPDQLGPWHDQTLSSCAVHMFPGDHFFLHGFRGQMLQVISRELKSTVDG